MRARLTFCRRSQIESLADQAFGQLDHRAFAQIVGAGLEAETKHADLCCPGRSRAQPAFDLMLVARQDRADRIGTSTSSVLRLV